MYAVFEDGSRQYRVSQGDRVKVDYREVAIGNTIEFNQVLLLANGDETAIGLPHVDGARIVGVVVEHPSTKVLIQQFRRRKNYMRLKGHRQPFTLVKVQHILKKGEAIPTAPEPAAAPVASESTTPVASETPAPAASEAPAAN